MMHPLLLTLALLPAAPLRDGLRVPEPDPLAAELARFPPPAVVASWLEFQRGYCDRLAFAAENGWSPGAGAAWWDQRERTSCWDDLDTAQNGALDECSRREALQRLRHALGGAAFAAGRMPDPVDLRTFSHAD